MPNVGMSVERIVCPKPILASTATSASLSSGCSLDNAQRIDLHQRGVDSHQVFEDAKSSAVVDQIALQPQRSGELASRVGLDTDGWIDGLRRFSGVCAATSSMSMPPREP